MKNFTHSLMAIFMVVGYVNFTFAQPPNDNFCNATVLTVNAGFCGNGLINGDNTAGSVEAGNMEPGISCGFDGGVATNTVWFSFVPTSSEVSVSTNFAGTGTNDDTQIVVYENNGTVATCPSPNLSNLIEIACNDDISTTNFLSELSCVFVTPGLTYFIQVDGWNGTQGSFCIEVSDAIPPSTCDASPDWVDYPPALSPVPVVFCGNDPDVGFPINDDPAMIYIPLTGFQGTEDSYDISISNGTGNLYSSTNPPIPQSDPFEGVGDGTIMWAGFSQADIDNAPGGVTTFSFSSCGTLCSTFDLVWATILNANNIALICPPPVCDLFGEVSLETTCVSLNDFTVDVAIGAGATGTAFTITNDQNSETLIGTGPGIYSFSTPIAQGTNVIVTVTQNMPMEAGCEEMVTITNEDCICFGSEPINNECANAININLASDSLTCVPVLVDTRCADQSSEQPICSATWFDDDVWYTIDIPAGFSANGINIASLFGAGDMPITNNGIAVYDACGGDQLGCYSGGSELYVDAALFSPPTTLFIRTWSAGNTSADEGTYEICAYELNCQITSVTAGAQSGCNPVDQTYTQEVIITYSGVSAAGDLFVNGELFPVTGSPQTVLLTGLPANDANPPVDVMVTFSIPSGCTAIFPEVFNAPATCVPLTCADGPFSFCYDNFAIDQTVGEVCPENPGETVRIAFSTASIEDGFDTLSVFSGPPGSGIGGTLLGPPLTGPLNGLVFESASDECIILVMNSNPSVSCGDVSFDPVVYDCFPDCSSSDCFFPACVITQMPLNQFPASLDELAWSGVSPAVTPGFNSTFEVCGVITYTGTTGEGGTFSHIALSNEAGNIDVIECANGITNSDLFPVGVLGPDCANPLTPDPDDLDTYTGLVNGDSYVFCVTYTIIEDFTNPDTDGVTEGTCSLYGIGLAFTPTECFANAGTFTNDQPIQLICFGDTVSFVSNGDWGNPFGSMAGDQNSPAGVIYGLWESTAPSGNWPLDDANFLGSVGSEPNGGGGQLVNSIGGNGTFWVTTIAATNEDNLSIGTEDCFDVNENDAVTYILLDEITADASFVCNTASTGFDITISNLTGGFPGFNMAGTYVVTDDAGGPGDLAVPIGGNYSVQNAAPGSIVTFTISDGICSEQIQIDIPDLTAPAIIGNDPYCISDPADLIFLNEPSGDYGTFELTVLFDQFPEESGFQVLDNGGEVVTQALPGAFAGVTNCGGFIFTLGPFLVSDGPFDLVFIDDFGDGMNSNNGVCGGTACGPGGFGLVDTGSGNELITLALFPGEGSDGDPCDAIDAGDTPVFPQSVSDIDGDGDDDQIITFSNLVLTPVTTAATYSGPGITDNLDGSAFFDPATAGVGVHPILVSWTDLLGCTINATELLTVEAMSQVSGNGISTWGDLMGGGQAFPAVNQPDGNFDSGVLSNECVPTPGEGIIQGLVEGNSNKPGEVVDLSKAPCTGTLSFNNAPLFYTLRTDPVDDPNDGPGDQLMATITPIANGNFSQLNIALYGPLINGSRMFPEAGATFIECEQGNGTSPTVLTADGLPPNTLYLIIVDTDGGNRGTGNFIIQGQGAALPLELLSFSGRPAKITNVLDWRTATEFGTAYFEIQRSLNSIDNFEEIGRVGAAGNSQAELSYSFIDEHPGLEGYYRLKMVDEDENYSYSDIIFVKREISEFILNGIFPNPVKETVTVHIESPVDVKLSVSLFDILGRDIARKPFEAIAGTNHFEIEMHDLASGVYMVVVEIENERFTRKLIKE
ncbi:MAG: T9SS type A sorting domain-containing protein [Bacteroidota bacterium]